jgi:hypothetical protein
MSVWAYKVGSYESRNEFWDPVKGIFFIGLEILASHRFPKGSMFHRISYLVTYIWEKGTQYLTLFVL